MLFPCHPIVRAPLSGPQRRKSICLQPTCQPARMSVTRAQLRFLPRRRPMSRSRVRLWLQALENRVAPAAGLLDPTFNGTGEVLVNIPGATTSAGRGVAVDAYGRTITAGYANIGGNDDFIA